MDPEPSQSSNLIASLNILPGSVKILLVNTFNADYSIPVFQPQLGSISLNFN
jgi:hypothetical protein